MKWTNTHFYDNNISKEVISKVNLLIDKYKNISKDNKLIAFNILKENIINLDNNKESIAIKYYDQIINSNNNNNYDPINKLNAIDLLYIVYIISREEMYIISQLKEQLYDLNTGFCPQGRTIRLLQIINPFL